MCCDMEVTRRAANCKASIQKTTSFSGNRQNWGHLRACLNVWACVSIHVDARMQGFPPAHLIKTGRTELFSLPVCGFNPVPGEFKCVGFITQSAEQQMGPNE